MPETSILRKSYLQDWPLSASVISGGFPSFLDKNGLLGLNYVEPTRCFVMNTCCPSGSLKFWYMLSTCMYMLDFLVHALKEEIKSFRQKGNDK